VDAGGTWDIKALSLPLEAFDPATLNIALDMRTTVELAPFTDGWVKVSSPGVSPGGESYPLEAATFAPPLGIFFAAVSWFAFHGLEVRIRSASPLRAALGGSSTALTALIKALAELRAALGGSRLSRKDILLLGYDLEDGLSGGFCGVQDQAAAVYGGVNLWRWRHGRSGRPFLQERLLDAKGRRALSERLLVAHSGLVHDSGRINRRWVEAFMAGGAREAWVEANRAVHELACAVRSLDWNGAAECLRRETSIRQRLTPEAFIPVTKALIEAAEEEECGARFAGAGGGGAVWALGPRTGIRELRKRWEGILSSIPGGHILKCAPDGAGAAARAGIRPSRSLSGNR
jgi:D-glycero-alpha-D-manno-heptose-7-phosphate kinase